MHSFNQKLIGYSLVCCLVLAGSSRSAMAQCEAGSKNCKASIGKDFISEGPLNRAFLDMNQVAEFRNTFHDGIIYRVAVGSGKASDIILFKVYDEEHNLLFESSKFDYPSCWDFILKNTTNCIIEAQIISEKESRKAIAGCLVMQIGIKK